MKNINSITKWINGSVDVMITHAITQQKHLTQSMHSTGSAVDIFTTLREFTKEPKNKKLDWVYGLYTNRLLQYKSAYIKTSNCLTACLLGFYL